MADYEDDFPYEGEFKSYFPTYESMTNPQLRGYFTWRTHVRGGTVERTSTSFAYVYLYELINGIGGGSGGTRVSRHRVVLAELPRVRARHGPLRSPLARRLCDLP